MNMLTGLLLKESLTDLGVLDRLNITKTETWHVTNAAEFQPEVWTAVSFEVSDVDAEAVGEELSRALKPRWYIDARWNEWVFVIFPQRIFKYRRGDQAGKAEAQAYALNSGVPSTQVDWGD
jgi:hypothetical protein